MTTHNQTKPPTTIGGIVDKIYNQAIDHAIGMCEVEIERCSYSKNTSAKEHIRTIILNLHKLKK